MPRTSPSADRPNFRPHSSRTMFPSSKKRPQHQHRQNPEFSTRRRNKRPPISNAHLFRSHRNLNPIFEERATPPRKRPRHSRSFDDRDFDMDDETYRNDSEEEEPIKQEDDDSFFHWEEEQTLFSDLMDDDPEDSDEKLAALTSSLQSSFDIESKRLKKEIAETLVPVVNRVKGFYQVLDEQVDPSFGRGVLMFNSACKEMEAIAIKEQDEVQRVYATTETNIERLFTQLQEAYARRDQLWVDLQKVVTDIVDPTLETVKAMPAKIERTITNLEKHSKSLEKNDGPSSTEEQLKALLGRV